MLIMHVLDHLLSLVAPLQHACRPRVTLFRTCHRTFTDAPTVAAGGGGGSAREREGSGASAASEHSLQADEAITGRRRRNAARQTSGSAGALTAPVAARYSSRISTTGCTCSGMNVSPSAAARLMM